ncbi:HIT domain-containing protein [Nocardioides sp.]|uniref:HIT domain-containing protein n=1 Tax=Nocardioides sp. TaxID=35761 RepID=UPI002BD4ED3B|nr:HIT domain-containing protein [Nocardioides sp.]HXH78488.1 HIT domain-containing protein [Nocardioides sp.]
MHDGAEYVGDDFYCDVALAHPAELDIVHEDDRVLAFHHTKPKWEFHLVVIPKRHIASLTRASAIDQDDVAAVLKVAQSLARGVEEELGAQPVMSNLGNYQDSQHLRVHIHSGARLRSSSSPLVSNDDAVAE